MRDDESGEEMTRVHFWISNRDIERLDVHYKGSQNIGRSKAVRIILRNYLNSIEAAAQASARRPEITDDSILPRSHPAQEP